MALSNRDGIYFKHQATSIPFGARELESLSFEEAQVRRCLGYPIAYCGPASDSGLAGLRRGFVRKYFYVIKGAREVCQPGVLQRAIY